MRTLSLLHVCSVVFTPLGISQYTCHAYVIELFVHYHPPCHSEVPLGIASAMAWNTGQETIDLDLTKTYSQFTTDAAFLLDKDATSFIKTDSRIFWCVHGHSVHCAHRRS